MAEWLKAAVLKTVRGESSSRVRIPLSPQIRTRQVFRYTNERFPGFNAQFFVGQRRVRTDRTDDEPLARAISALVAREGLFSERIERSLEFEPICFFLDSVQ